MRESVQVEKMEFGERLHINPHTWLLTYFYHCAMHGGQAPSEISEYLPWNMPKEVRAVFASPPEHQQPIDSG